MSFAAELLREAPDGPDAERLTALVAEAGADPSWEVRNAVAAALAHLRQAGLDQVLAALCRDDHGYVRRTAEATLRRRSRLSRTERKHEEQIEAVVGRIERLARRNSPRVAAQVRALARAYTGYIVPAGAHDIRSVLTALKQSLVRAEREVLSPRTGAKAWQEFRKTTERRLATIEKIASDMKDLASRGALEVEPTNLARLVGEALQDVQDRFHGDPRAPRVTVRVEVDATLALDAPRNELRRAIQNILRNAFEAIEGEGAVSIRGTHVGDEEVELRIQDTGCGIPAEDLPLVFVPGHSTKKGKRQHPDKTGYGLPIAQQIVEDCHGRLEVSSVEGEGTTFVIVLPLRHVDDEA